MHKVLLILGLLLRGPLYGYELHRIVRAHGELYADLKKANLYYLLEQLAKDGFLSVTAETGTRGARGERLVYTLTDQGRTHFAKLLRETVTSYEPVHTGVDTAIVFLSTLQPEEGLDLLRLRRQAVARRREEVAASLGDLNAMSNPLVYVASDHLLCLIDAELAWIDRSLTYLREHRWETASHTPSQCEDNADLS